MSEMNVGQLRKSLEHLPESASIAISVNGQWHTLGRVISAIQDDGAMLFADPLEKPSLNKPVNNPGGELDGFG